MKVRKVRKVIFITLSTLFYVSQTLAEPLLESARNIPADQYTISGVEIPALKEIYVKRVAPRALGSDINFVCSIYGSAAAKTVANVIINGAANVYTMQNIVASIAPVNNLESVQSGENSDSAPDGFWGHVTQIEWNMVAIAANQDDYLDYLPNFDDLLEMVPEDFRDQSRVSLLSDGTLLGIYKQKYSECKSSIDKETAELLLTTY